MKLAAKFDQNPPGSFGTIVKKNILQQKSSQTFTLKVKVIAEIKNHDRNKKHASQKNLCRRSLLIGVTPSCTDTNTHSSKTICPPPPYEGLTYNSVKNTLVENLNNNIITNKY